MPPAEGIQTPLTPNLFARLTTAARYAITGVAPSTWFGPQQPLAPMAPPEVKGRQFDYPFGVNIDYAPRSNQAIGFAELRALADALPLLRTIIETRKDQIAASSFSIRPRNGAAKTADSATRIKTISAFLDRPDRRHSFAAWLRMLLEDMLVIDAATIYPRLSRAGALYSLDIIDGATITPLVGEDGRAPEAPDPAYQQVLHGIPAADFSADELLYLPRNVRSHRLYGMSPVEQIALTINIALRRDAATLEYYRSGSIRSRPDAPIAFADCFTFTLPSGLVLTYTNVDQPVTYSGVTFAANGPLVQGLKYRCAAGLDVDKQQITIAARPTDLVSGAMFLNALREGAFDGCIVQRDRVFMTALGQPPIGGVTLFHGRISTIDQVGRTSAKITVASDLILLDMDMPRNVYSATCLHTLYDSGCGLLQGTFATPGSVGAGSTTTTINFPGALAQHTQGSILFTSGANANVRATVKAVTPSAALGLMYPLPSQPSTGDAFTVYQGCDHTPETCQSQFNNLANFRGFPYVPPPQIAY